MKTQHSEKDEHMHEQQTRHTGSILEHAYSPPTEPTLAEALYEVRGDRFPLVTLQTCRGLCANGL
jgi:hypothetical protein